MQEKKHLKCRKFNGKCNGIELIGEAWVHLHGARHLRERLLPDGIRLCFPPNVFRHLQENAIGGRIESVSMHFKAILRPFQAISQLF